MIILFNVDSFQKSRVSKQKIQALNFFDKSIKVVKEIPTELIYTKALYRFPDMIFIGENDEIYIIEFQTGKIKKDHLYRFTTYGAITAEKYRKKVNIIIIYTEKVDTNINHDEGSIKFNPMAYTFKDVNGDEILKRLKNKISNNIKLNENELDELEFLPLFQSNLSSKEILWETVNLTNELNFISQKEIDHIKTGQALLLNWFFKDSKEIKKSWM